MRKPLKYHYDSQLTLIKKYGNNSNKRIVSNFSDSEKLPLITLKKNHLTTIHLILKFDFNLFTILPIFCFSFVRFKEHSSVISYLKKTKNIFVVILNVNVNDLLHIFFLWIFIIHYVFKLWLDFRTKRLKKTIIQIKQRLKNRNLDSKSIFPTILSFCSL